MADGFGRNRSAGNATRGSFPLIGMVSVLAFIACVPVSNWMIGSIGTVCVPNGPCLIPVWPGIEAPSGVLVAGLAFVLRDLIQETLGTRWAIVALFVGGLISALIASPALAVASVSAYLLSEALDMGVFTALRAWGFLLASVCSSIVGLLLDSTVFVWLAFGSPDYIIGQALGKAWMVAFAIPLLILLRRRLWRMTAPA